MINTLADFPPDRSSITAYCDDCEQGAQVVIERLPESMTIHRLRAGLRCSECGSRQTRIIISYC